jgi:hypothetical protein
MQGMIKPVSARCCQYKKIVVGPAFSVFPR